MNSGITSGHLFACDPTHRNARNPQGCSRRLLMRHATEPRPRTPRLVTSRIRWLVCRPQQNRCEKDVASSPSMFNRRRVPTPPGRARPVSPRFGRAWRVRDFLKGERSIKPPPASGNELPCRICYARRINGSVRLSVLSFGLRAPRRDE